jgi:hypothetical protein
LPFARRWRELTIARHDEVAKSHDSESLQHPVLSRRSFGNARSNSIGGRGSGDPITRDVSMPVTRSGSSSAANVIARQKQTANPKTKESLFMVESVIFFLRDKRERNWSRVVPDTSNI